MGRVQKEQRFHRASEQERSSARTHQLDGRLKRARTKGKISSRFPEDQEVSRGADAGRAPDFKPRREVQWIGERYGQPSSPRARQILFRRGGQVVCPWRHLRNLPAE